MIQFNIIGKGFLEMNDGGLSFKQSNSFWRFAEVSLGRSVEFSVHGSRHNRALLEYGDDADEFGEMLRATYPCQMIAGMTAVFGTISVTAYDGDEFKCCFYIGNTEKLEALKNRSLSDIAIDSDPIAWATTTPVGTETADGIVALLDYEYPVPVTAWQRLPSINAKLYAQAVLSQIGIACNGIDSDVWLVAGSINGGGEDAITLTQTALDDAAITQTQNYFDKVDIDLKMVELGNFGIPISTIITPTKGFKATQNLELTFPDPMPNNVYLIKWDNRPKKCTTIGGKPLRSWYEFHTLDGRTVTLTKGDIVFFATVPAPDYRGSLDLRGFYGSEYAVTSVAVNVKRTTELTFGENWYLQNNAPNMTVWEFLRSLALAIGKEIVVTVNPSDIDDVSVDFVDSDYGVNYIRPADEVISTELVKRRVDSWGDDTANAVIEFDSEDYVTERLRTVYEVQTTQIKGEASYVAKFSEGNAGATMVYIKDNDDGKFSAKKWTIARRVGDELHRIEAPFPFGYDDIAVASTCVTMKMAATIEDFLSLQPQTTYLWRGLAYIWTDANWSGNVMSLTLQKVSQPPQAEIPADIGTPLKLVSEDNNLDIRIDKEGLNAALLTASLEYSFDDGVTWTPYTWTGNTGDTITLINEGDSVMFRGDNAQFSQSDDAYFHFIVSGYFYIAGQVTSLLSKQGGDVALPTGAFIKLFYDNDGLSGISSNDNPFPSTTLAFYCYYMMFADCGEVQGDAILPAETLAANCYESMFDGCSWFGGGVYLHATDISATDCLKNWLNAAGGTGVIFSDPNLNLPSGGSGVPTGWTWKTMEGYIADGLILDMDGILKGDTPDTWTSLVGGHAFVASGGVTFADDHLEFDGTDDRLDNETYSTVAYNVGTIEFVADNERTGSLGTVFVPNTGLAAFLNNNTLRIRSGNASGRRYDGLPAIGSISATQAHCYANGVEITTTSTGYYSNGHGSHIGARYNNSYGGYFKGKIYSIRIYNRQLSAAEVEINRQVDIARFGIGN